jgi:hypothetical protein
MNIDYSFSELVMCSRSQSCSSKGGRREGKGREEKKKRDTGNEKWKSLKGEKVISQMNLIQLMKAAASAVLVVGFVPHRSLSIRNA